MVARRRGCGCGGLVAVIIVILVVVIAVAGLGYLGIVPGVAGLFGSAGARDLGVRFTPADLASYNAKGLTRVTALPAGTAPGDSMEIGGSVPVKASFTSEELTAVAAEREKQWAYWPVTGLQVKIGQDGTVEASGILRVDRAYGYAAAVGLPASGVNQALQALKFVGGNPPVYIRGTGSVTNGKVNLDVQQLEIGRLSVPGSILVQETGVAASAVEQVLRATGMQANSVTFAGGQVNYDGSKPETRGLSAGQ